MYHHVLRVSEVVAIRLDQLNLKQARIWVGRSKNLLSTEQAVDGDELRAVKRYLAQRDDHLPSLFISERPTNDAPGGQLSGGRRGRACNLGGVWPHMLRHSACYALSNKDHDFRLLQDHVTSGSSAHRALYANDWSTLRPSVEITFRTQPSAHRSTTELPLRRHKKCLPETSVRSANSPVGFKRQRPGCS